MTDQQITACATAMAAWKMESNPNCPALLPISEREAARRRARDEADFAARQAEFEETEAKREELGAAKRKLDAIIEQRTR